MRILLFRNVRHLTVDALFLSASLILSYIEIVTGISSVIPLPGMKIGLANIALMTAVYVVNIPDIIIISILKIILTSILFSTPVSFLYSLAGGILSLTVLLIIRYIFTVFSFMGIGMACAVSHNIGQFAVSYFMFGNSALYYLPFLILAGMICGIVSGIVCISISPILLKVFKR